MTRYTLRVLGALGALLVTVVIAAAAVGASYTANTEIPEGAPGAHVVVNGVPIRVVQKGTGRDLLLIHGSPGSIEDFDAVMDTLARRFRVTAYDRPGNGFSGDTGQYSFEHNADVALALIARLKLEHVIVAGHSYGGTTALAMALRSPPAVDAYVVIDSAAYTPSRQADATLRLVKAPVIGIGFGAIFGPIVAKKKIERGILDQFPEHAPSPEFVKQRVAIWSSPKVTHAIAAETLGSASALAAQSPRYPTIRQPVYLLAEADNAFRRTTAERVHHEVPGSVLELVSGTGHYLQFEVPETVIAMIERAAREHVAAR